MWRALLLLVVITAILKAIKIFLILELQKSLWYYLPIHKEKISVHNNSIRR
nr:MAG TPA: hypothetical protein [Caudoviricetes sp.]